MGRRPNTKCCPLISPHARVHAHTNKYNVKTKPERTPCSHAITPPHPAVCNHCNTGQTPAEKPKWYHYRKLGSCIPNGAPFQALYGHHWVLLLTTYSTEICLLLPPLLFFSEGGWSWTYLQSPEDLTLVTCDTSLTGVWHHIHWTECWGDWPWGCKPPEGTAFISLVKWVSSVGEAPNKISEFTQIKRPLHNNGNNSVLEASTHTNLSESLDHVLIPEKSVINLERQRKRSAQGHFNFLQKANRHWSGAITAPPCGYTFCHRGRPSLSPVLCLCTELVRS